MELSQSVLVVVDVQNGFISPHSQPVVDVILDVVNTWKAGGGDVLFSRYLNYPGSQFERLIHWSKLQSSPETDIVSELQEAAAESLVLDKTIYSIFSEDGHKLVKEHDWKDFVFCGIATESCVLKSAVDAFELGYTPWVLRDACASHAGNVPHEAGLLVAKRFIGSGQIVDSGDLLSRFGLTLESVR